MVKVSVLIPFYNSEAFLKPCIDSVLRQTFTDFELILLTTVRPTVRNGS